MMRGARQVLAWLLLLTATFVSLSLLVLPSSQANPPYALDIAPDCSEQPFSIEQLLELEKKPHVDSMVDFLKLIPPHALQTFTFVHRSNSFQHHGVDKLWPRVLRMSANGKLALSFVCNPFSQDYNRVEVLYYVDPPTAGWRSVSMDFRNQKSKYKKLREEELFPALNGRTHQNQMLCAKCHSSSGKDINNIKPIFAQYKTWGGFYGSDDDVVHKNSTEYNDYNDFLQIAQSDPCYSTLPWTKTKDPVYALYPYHEGFDLATQDLDKILLSQETEKIKVRNYHLRPNLKFIDAFSHLMAERLAWKFIRDSRYSEVSALLAMESVNCDDGFVGAELERSIPGYKSPVGLKLNTYMDPRTESSRTKHLYALSQLWGMNTGDFNMHFNQPENPYYNTGAAGHQRRDTSIARMAQSVLLKKLAEKFPEINGLYYISRGVSEFFAPQDFSCIDDIAGQVYVKSIDQRERLCQRLKNIYLSRATLRPAHQTLFIPPQLLTSPPPLETKPIVDQVRREFGNPLSPQSVSRGQKLTEQHCTDCHGAAGFLPQAYRFLETEDSFKQSLRQDPHLLWNAITYLESGRMPKDDFLTPEEIADVQSYILDLATK